MVHRATRVLAIADTHLGPGRAEPLIDELASELAAADAIIHAGDIIDGSVLDALGVFAPVHAVRGNNDHGIDLPERCTVTLAGCRIAIVHDSGASTGRARRLRRWFPDADVVVFGHSHLPWYEINVRPGDGHVQHQLNPGSAVQRRRAPRRTVARVDIAERAVRAVDLVAL